MHVCAHKYVFIHTCIHIHIHKHTHIHTFILPKVVLPVLHIPDSSLLLSASHIFWSYPPTPSPPSPVPPATFSFLFARVRKWDSQISFTAARSEGVIGFLLSPLNLAGDGSWGFGDHGGASRPQLGMPSLKGESELSEFTPKRWYKPMSDDNLHMLCRGENQGLGPLGLRTFRGSWQGDMALGFRLIEVWYTWDSGRVGYRSIRF